MRIIILAALYLLVGCGSTVTSEPLASGGRGGTPYALPKGLVPVQVFADANGIGLTIEPAQNSIDNEVGTLVARVVPSAFNNEDIKISANPATGFLSSISTSSEAQLLAIVEEAAKTAGRLAFQNSRAEFLRTKVVVFEDSFDPYSQFDVDRINSGVNSAVRRAAEAFASAEGGSPQTVSSISLLVALPDGTPIIVPGDRTSKSQEDIDTGICSAGVCARTMTSRLIQVVLDGEPFASKLVDIPTREIIAVPVPSSILANQDITIGMKDGIVDKYELKRDSEALGLIKLPGAAISGLFSGLTQGLADRRSVIDERKKLAESEEALFKASSARDEAAAALGNTTTPLQSAPAAAATGNSYAAVTLTVYPFSETLSAAIAERIKSASETAAPAPSGGGDLLEPPNTEITN